MTSDRPADSRNFIILRPDRAANPLAPRAPHHAARVRNLGLDHLRLTFRHNGRNERLTENDGELITQALS